MKPELDIGLMALEKAFQAGKNESQRIHHGYPSLSSRNTRRITPELRSQFSVSRSNCFSPRFVME
jgi:hypothetical protein